MKKLTLLTTLLLTAPLTYAQPYKWVDKEGQIHYSTVPPNGATYTRPPTPPSRAPRMTNEDQTKLDTLERRTRSLGVSNQRPATERRQEIKDAEEQIKRIQSKYGIRDQPDEQDATHPSGVLIETEDGAIDSVTGKFYPSAGAGAVKDPQTGKIFPAAGAGAVIDPQTGKYYPRSRQAPSEPPAQ